MLMAERRAAARTNAPLRDLFDLMGAARDPESGEASPTSSSGDWSRR